jgi:hypothetical protein
MKFARGNSVIHIVAELNKEGFSLFSSELWGKGGD